MDANEFMDSFLAHRSLYDPVKAREYYLRTRKLKGLASPSDVAKAKEYEKRENADAQKRLNADLKKTPVSMNKKRRIGAAEQKLIRAKSLANRIKDPDVKADTLKRLALAEKKFNKVKASNGLLPNKLGQSIKPILKTKPKRVEEDEVPMKSRSGAKLVDYNGKGAGKAVYSDGSTFDGNGWTKPIKKAVLKRSSSQ